MQDISRYYTTETLESILEACNIAFEKNMRVCYSSHLLASLLKKEKIQQILAQSRINIEELMTKVNQTREEHTRATAVRRGVVIFSPDLKISILRAYLIATSHGINEVGIEELFLSILYSPEIQSLISALNIDIKEVEYFLIGAKGGQVKKPGERVSYIDKFTVDLTEIAQKGEIEEIVDREKELSQLSRTILRSTKNNVILIGEVGVGKSTIVRLLAKKISKGEYMEQLRDVKVYELNISTLFSSLNYQNLNEVLESFQDELQQQGKTIIFIKNFDIGTYEKSPEKIVALNLIKALLTVSNVQIIISMSSASYKNLLSQDQIFTQHFEPVKVSEPSVDFSTKILEQSARRISQFHNINIPDNVISTCVKLSKRYIQDRYLPSKAIDLLDETSSKANLENRKEITIEDVKKIVSDKTGIPVDRLTESEQKKLMNLEEILNKSVKGQKEAVHIVSEVVRRSRAGLKDPKKPIGSFLFLGPSGVGKTYLAQNLTKIIYDSENAMIRLDMSEFSESHTVQRLIGSPPGYIGYEEGGQLTNPIWERPYSLILLDEIEKAHPKVFDIFLQVLDEGRLTDGQGRTVDFKNTIIIATSNIASEEILEKTKKQQKGLTGFSREKFLEEEIHPILKEYFRIEFINRFDDIVLFNPLSVDVLVSIAKLQIDKIQKKLEEKKIQIKISDNKLLELAEKSYNPAFGARPLIRIIQEQIENTLARKIVSGEIREGDVATF